MLSPYFQEHWLDAYQRPAGGVSCGTGFCISWQNGPLGRADEPGGRKPQNGAFVESVIDACARRIEFYENTQFACDENKAAIHHLKEALRHLNERTARREAERTEGTHAGS